MVLSSALNDKVTSRMMSVAISDGEFVMARLIENILGKYPLGIGDWWYAKRISRMIQLDELVVLQKQKEIYSQRLKKRERLSGIREN
jgi:hypothetical protein